MKQYLNCLLPAKELLRTRDSCAEHCLLKPLTVCHGMWLAHNHEPLMTTVTFINASISLR